MRQNAGGRIGGQGLAQLQLGVFALQPLFQPTVPIIQTRMVACNQVGQNVAVRLVRLIQLQHGPQRTSGRVGFFAPPHFAFDVCIRVVGQPHIVLKTRPVFAQVMPKACLVTPVPGGIIQLKKTGQFRRQFGHRPQMVNQQMSPRVSDWFRHRHVLPIYSLIRNPALCLRQRCCSFRPIVHQISTKAWSVQPNRASKPQKSPDHEPHWPGTCH
jgi:hypothetical protein